MKRASIVTVGNEILSGQTVDTNAAYLSGNLLSIGIPVVSSYTVGDDVDQIAQGLERACNDGDVVLATGGLGPTDDDVTRQALAKFLGTELQFQDELLKKIRQFFVRRNVKMSTKNRVQAYLPAGTRALPNHVGTAPGIMAEVKGKLVFAFPGVPSEMQEMFEQAVLDRLKALAAEQAIVVRKLRCFGTGESNIAELIGPFMERGRNPLVNCTTDCGVITLHIIAASKDESQALKMARRDEESLRDVLGGLIYGTNDQTLAEVVGQRLARQKKTLAVAESCTGGVLAKLITDVPGASRYFTHGWVTYSNPAKITELGVDAGLIDKYGAVSEQVALGMARGARKRAQADFAIGITGIAGPAGGTEQKPVGLVYISVDWDGGTETKRFIMSGDRGSIRLRAAKNALNILRLTLHI